MSDSEIQLALDDVFDQAVVFHAYTDYMRDYEVFTFAVSDPATGIPPSYDRYLFRLAVEVNTVTTVRPEVWARSLDDRLIDYEQGKDLDGYVWGVKWHLLYPGAKVVQDSPRAALWFGRLGIPFREVQVNTNAHDIAIVFSDLVVSRGLPTGFAPFVVGDDATTHHLPS